MVLRKTYQFFTLFFVFALLTSFSVRWDNLSKTAQKKIDKTLGALWEDQSVVREEVNFSTEKLSFKVAPFQFFKLKSGNQLVGYMYLDQGDGKFDKFDYMVIFSPSLKIMTSQVLVYREDYGGEIGSKRWLRQFEGKTNGTQMEFGKDIQNISGATISARSISFGIRRLSKNINEMKSVGAI